LAAFIVALRLLNFSDRARALLAPYIRFVLVYPSTAPLRLMCLQSDGRVWHKVRSRPTSHALQVPRHCLQCDEYFSWRGVLHNVLAFSFLD
jgi:hypothetical protein